MQRILFFTKYTSKGPSSRYRTYQYLDYFREDYECLVFPFFDDKYIEKLYSGRSVSFFRIIYYYLRRIWKLLTNVKKSDILFIEYELIPYFFAWAETCLKLCGVKYVVDYDDAIFHNYDMSKNLFIRELLHNKIPKVIRLANHVITGSPYLTAFAAIYNTKVSEIPTSIVFEKYNDFKPLSQNSSFVIGWIGSKSTSSNLLIVKDALKSFRQNHINVIFRFVGIDDETAKTLDVTSVKWFENNELQELNSFNVGIMPLKDNDFNKGKCGFKLIQYMACGKPTISTPLDANVKINRNKKNLHATTNQEWLQAFEQVYANQSYFSEVGRENKKDIADYYSVEGNALKYKLIFKDIDCM